MEYGLTSDPNAEVSDQELLSIIRSIRQDTVYSGVSMMWGSLRARGVKVTRERVRQALRSIDPISVALRWPAGATRRRPYSVAGPNSLWHIGMYVFIQVVCLVASYSSLVHLNYTYCNKPACSQILTTS